MFSVAAAAAPVDGYWLGTLRVDDANERRLQLNVESDASGLRCKLDSLDQQVYGIECSNVRIAQREFSFDIPGVSGRYIGTLSADGKHLSGTWTQRMTCPPVFERQATLQAPPPARNRPSSPLCHPSVLRACRSSWRKIFDHLLKSGPLSAGTGIGVTIGVQRDGERRVLSFGAATPDSLFEIGSITKTFTGLVLAQMIEQQQVTAEQPVRTLLPANAVPNRAARSYRCSTRSHIVRDYTAFRPISSLRIRPILISIIPSIVSSPISRSKVSPSQQTPRLPTAI
jgi:serine-type D-Ala-D-Ala carboxypeptidase/endopeptidase